MPFVPPRFRVSFSNHPIGRSSATEITISAPVPERISVMSWTRMPRLMAPPRPPPPTKAAKTAVPIALTTAMRMPVNTVGKARGNSTSSVRYALLMPMPRAASFTPPSTSWSPRQVLRTMGRRE